MNSHKEGPDFTNSAIDSRFSTIMRKIAILGIALLCTLLSATGTMSAAGSSAPETLTYDVMYKWGLIHKKAGSVTLTSRHVSSGKELNATLTASTAPWADKFFELRDTLIGRMDSRTLFPTYYERIAHEGGSYAHDILNYTRTDTKVSATASLWRKRKKSTEITQSEKFHEAEGKTLDMLSAFYYMRHIDYTSMKKGESVKLNIFSGQKKEMLTIHYQGTEKVKIGNKEYTGYHITFTFTTEGGKVSSDNMDAWISTEASHIPLLMEGKLPVGKVRAVYSGPLP